MAMLLYSTILTMTFLVYGTKTKLEREAKRMDESRRESLSKNENKKVKKRDKKEKTSSTLDNDDKQRLSANLHDVDGHPKIEFEMLD